MPTAVKPGLPMRCWPDSVLCSSVMFSWDKDNPPRGSCASPGRDIPSALFLTEFRKKRSTFWCNAVLPLTKRHCPNGVGRSFGLAGPVARTCLILHFRPHPCGCVRKRRGLSPELKKCPLDTFLPAQWRAALFESHPPHKRKAPTRGAVLLWGG